MSDLMTVLAVISVFANRISEAVKASLKAHFPGLATETISEVALFVSLLAGIVGALLLNINLLTLVPDNPYFSQIPPWVGVVVTGCIASVGSEGLHWLFDLLQAGRERLLPPAEVVHSESLEVKEVATSSPER